MNTEETIQSFLQFMEKHADEDMEIRGNTGVISTRGCDGAYGTCCAKTFDVGALVNALKNLAGGTAAPLIVPVIVGNT